MGNSLTPVVKNLLIINILLFIISVFVGYQFKINLNQILGLFVFSSDQFQPYQLFTHMFMHQFIGPDGGIYLFHILSNMFGLFMFGPSLESVWGPKRFLIFYIVCGLGAALLHVGVIYYEIYPILSARNLFMDIPTVENLANFLKAYSGSVDTNFINDYKQNLDSQGYISGMKTEVEKAFQAAISFPTFGASGAVFGILLGFGMLFPNTIIMPLFPPIPMKAKYFVMIYGALELYAGVSPTPGDSVAHFAHLGGMLFGFILIKYWQKQRNSFY